MFTSKISFAIVAALAAAGAAQAQSFDGPFAGVQAGWSQNDVRNPSTNLGVVPLVETEDSAVIGGFAGYDKTFGKFVLGAELGLNFGIEDTIEAGSGAGLVSIDPKRSLDFSARAGYLVTPDTLLYGRAGYTNERIRTTFGSGAGAVIASEDRDGWLIGGGVERKLTDNISARIEYRYADLSEGDGKYDRHQVLTGVAYRF